MDGAGTGEGKERTGREVDTAGDCGGLGYVKRGEGGEAGSDGERVAEMRTTSRFHSRVTTGSDRAVRGDPGELGSTLEGSRVSDCDGSACQCGSQVLPLPPFQPAYFPSGLHPGTSGPERT